MPQISQPKSIELMTGSLGPPLLLSRSRMYLMWVVWVVVLLSWTKVNSSAPVPPTP